MSSWHCSSHAVRPRVGIKAVIIWPKLAQKQSWVGLIPVILRPIKVGIEAVMSWQNECFPLESDCQTLLDYNNERLLTTFLLFSSKESSPNFTYFVINSPSGFTTTKQDVRTSYIRRFSNSADTTMLCPATQGWRQWPVSVASGWLAGRLAGWMWQPTRG